MVVPIAMGKSMFRPLVQERLQKVKQSSVSTMKANGWVSATKNISALRTLRRHAIKASFWFTIVKLPKSKKRSSNVQIMVVPLPGFEADKLL